MKDALDTVSTELLREYFRQTVPEKDFHTVLNDEPTKEKLLEHLTNDQKNILYPNSGVFNGTYNDFDIGLLYILIRNWTEFPSHKKGWGKKPFYNDNSASANIERIRLLRNKYIHPTPALKQLKDTEFEDVMNKLIFWIQGVEMKLSGTNITFQEAAKTILNEAKNHEKCQGISFILKRKRILGDMSAHLSVRLSVCLSTVCGHDIVYTICKVWMHGFV